MRTSSGWRTASNVLSQRPTSATRPTRTPAIPDFTRGNWKNVQPWGIVNVDLEKMGIGVDNVSNDNAALSV